MQGLINILAALAVLLLSGEIRKLKRRIAQIEADKEEK